MATNKIQDGQILRLTVGSTVDANEPVVVGNALRGVAITDYSSADGKAEVDIGPGVYDLSVTATDPASSAVAVGDRLYSDGTTITKNKTGKFFGIALEAISAGETATINVLLGGGTPAPDGSAFQIIAAGIHTVDDSPLAAAEFIAIAGCLATDIVLASLHTNTGSPDLYVIGAVAAASPAGITITASGTYTAGDKINYAVLRASL